jgi:hypothetical protein
MGSRCDAEQRRKGWSFERRTGELGRVPILSWLMKRSSFLRLLLTGAVAAPAVLRGGAAPRRRKLVLIAGVPSHPPMMHEHRAGNLLLAKRLRAVPGLTVECHEMGWVRDEATLADADAVVIFSDGGGGHPAIQGERLGLLQELVDRGVGFGCIHYAVEVPKEHGATQLRDWIGGCYEHAWSCNPMWTASYETFPDHPVCRGVQPFAIHDEWYFNMRFRSGFGAEGPSTEDGIRFTRRPSCPSCAGTCPFSSSSAAFD